MHNNSYQLRPFAEEDAEAIHELHNRASAASLYYRFMRSYEPNYRDAQHITSTGKGLVIIDDVEESQIVGYAYFVVYPHKPSEAEFAILMEDEYQGFGLGRYLLSQFCRFASSQGIEQLRATVHGSNDVMKHILHSLDYPIQSSWDYGEYVVALDLTAKEQNIVNKPERG